MLDDPAFKDSLKDLIPLEVFCNHDTACNAIIEWVAFKTIVQGQ